MNEAECFIFWSFVNFMEITQQDRIFAELEKNQSFILKRAKIIATSIHIPLKVLIEEDNFRFASLLFRPILLLFKREFKYEHVLRLWDSILTSETPYLFIRFFTSAILILLYPKFLIFLNSDLDFSKILDDSFDLFDINAGIKLSISLYNKINSLPIISPELRSLIMEPIPSLTDFDEYQSKYLVKLNM